MFHSLAVEMQRLKKILKKIMLVLASIAGLLAFIALISSAVKKQQTLLCTDLGIHIDYQTSKLKFLSEADVADRVRFVCKDSVTHLKVSSLNLKLIEQDIEQLPFVDSAEVFLNQKQELHVNVFQKRPILRIINNDNVSYYLTNKNQKMPLSTNFTARVPIAMGNVLSNKSAKRDSIFQNALFELITALRQDTFFNAFIDQIIVDENGEIELVPLSGTHTVLFGFAHEQISKKLQRLKTFYKEAMPRKGWNTYEKLNVKFDNQIVCVKSERQAIKDTTSLTTN